MSWRCLHCNFYDTLGWVVEIISCLFVSQARNVEYVDKEVEEWEKFQSEIKQETEISEQIAAEDDTDVTEERHVQEIDEQL